MDKPIFLPSWRSLTREAGIFIAGVVMGIGGFAFAAQIYGVAAYGIPAG